jgi:beta-mannosidase
MGHIPQQASARPLSQNWSFTQVGGGQGTKNGEWLNVSQFPTTVHVELLRLGRIPDPVRACTTNNFVRQLKRWREQFIGMNEWNVQCAFASVYTTAAYSYHL